MGLNWIPIARGKESTWERPRKVPLPFLFLLSLSPKELALSPPLIFLSFFTPFPYTHTSPSTPSSSRITMTTAIPAAELAGHTERSTGLWMAIHGKVYNITDFIEEHPGGEDILFEQGGMDATAAFEDVGHSEEARESLKKYLVGPLDGDVSWLFFFS